ncbi:DUF6494 family protein [Alphaproteobacteria bacterium]|jgi:hypothetical protein|nr:DUF6494 family protein [Alphaproteobacteria bacterium]MDB9824921.1 DUF6494 family protein [Alphaproteobacteria bacterium]|tara:strand:+ start:4115 stop:4303 length:189 start_codon:yes stop_codon:yes gene_type:complete
MTAEDTQLAIRKFLKKLGINSQNQLHKFIDSHPDVNELNVSVKISVNDEDLLTLDDKVKVTK